MPEETDATLKTEAPDTKADVVEAWWRETFPGSPIARDTDAWNFALAAKDDLKKRLAR